MQQEEMTLAGALGFSAEDLAANRAGSLSDAQKVRLGRQIRRTLTGFGILLLIGIIAATAFLFGGQQTGSQVLTFVGMAITVLNAVVVGLGAQSYLRVNGDLSRGTVERVSGIVTHTIRVTSGRVTTFVIKLDGGHETVVPKTVFKAFAEGGAYTLYRAPGTKSLLSADEGKEN